MAGSEHRARRFAAKRRRTLLHFTYCLAPLGPAAFPSAAALAAAPAPAPQLAGVMGMPALWAEMEARAR